MTRFLMMLLALSLSFGLRAEEPDTASAAALQQSVEQLRSVAKAVDGSREFEWVVPDRVARGRNAISMM